MFREASTIAIAPPPVPVPNETVPSYDTGHTKNPRRIERGVLLLVDAAEIHWKCCGFAHLDFRIAIFDLRSRDDEINRKSQIQNRKFLRNVDRHVFAGEAEVRTLASLHKFRGGLRKGSDDHRQSDRRIAGNIRCCCST